MEDYFKRSAVLILPLFIAYKKVRGGMEPKDWWESIPRQIQGIFNKHASNIAQIGMEKELFFPAHIRIIKSLPEN